MYCAGPAIRTPRSARVAFTAARSAGKLHVSCLGLGVDPLTLVTDILTVAVFDSDFFDAATCPSPVCGCLPWRHHAPGTSRPALPVLCVKFTDAREFSPQP